MTTTIIYVYCEHATLKGRIAHVEADEEPSDDVFLYGEGTEEDIIKQALENLARPCSAAPHFRHTCDRAVLEYLGGPVVEAHYENGKGSYWLPVPECDDDGEPTS